jgi:polysaccharide pyruvyl transferase WcaK-like protein
MRIFIDPSSVHCLNLGDVAMMQVTYRRLRQLWPDANIHVFNDDPQLLEMYCPGAIQEPMLGRQSYYSTASILTRLGRRFSLAWLSELDVRWRHAWPKLTERLVRSHVGEAAAAAVQRFVELIRGCDLVVVSGAGQINTVFSAASTPLLNTLQLAIDRGIPTVIFGQGIGPIDDSCLRARALKVLPRVNLICLRETLTGPKLLQSLQVPQRNIVVTGDDAIETAHSRRPANFGSAIGVNLRISWYSQVPKELIESLRRPLQEAAREVGASLLTVPISRHPDEDDSGICDQLFAGYEAIAAPEHDTTYVEGIVDEIGRCRVVLTTSYHGGVFALSQGVPVVAWLRSKYFASKMYGLANQFGVGCEVVALDEGNLEERLRTSIVAAWHSAEQVRPGLLEAASAQVASSKAAYERMSHEVPSLRPPHP